MAKGTRKLEIIITASARGAKRVFDKLKVGMRNVVSVGAKVGAGLAAGFAVAAAAVVALTVKVLNLGDNLAKTADKLGITTEELSALRHAGELAGLTISDIDRSLQFMQRNIAEAADGMSAQADAFDKLGLSIEDVQKAGPGDAMQMIIKGLAGIENQTEKTQIAMDIFGRSGAGLLNLTAEGLERARKEADLFGISMSRQDAKAMENINDSITRVKAAITGASIQLVKTFAPALEKLGAKLVEWSTSGKLSQWAKDLGKFLVDVIPKGINIVITGIGHLLTIMRGWQLLLSEIRIQWLNILILIQKGIVAAARFAGADNLSEQRKVQELMVQDRDKAILQQFKMIQGQKKEQTELEQIKKNVDGFVQSLDNGTSAVVKQTEEVKSLANAYNSAAVAAQNLSNVGPGGSAPGQRTFGDPNLLANLSRTEGD